MEYKEALEYLGSLSKFGTRMGLKRMQELMQYLSLPQEKYKTIHVTGTNGKGSVSAMLNEIFVQSGIKVGIYTSPHLVSYRERIRINGQLISEHDFASCIDVVRTFAEKMVHNGSEHPTQFEVITAAAFLHFAINGVEYAVIEVGLGGSLDSTNVIHPIMAIITNIAFEHAEYCGGTIEGIANCKAGIIKEGIPVITGAKGLPLDIIRQEAQKQNADVFVSGKEFHAEFVQYQQKKQVIRFTAEILGISEDFALRLLGDYQVDNCAIALMATYLLANDEPRLTLENVHTALEIVRWNCRFEILHREEDTIIIDGAHNPAGMAALRQNLDKYFPDRKRVFLLGILKDKDISLMTKTLLRENDYVIATVPNSPRRSNPNIWLDNLAGEVVMERELALKRALHMLEKDVVLCITGSLYLVGEMREILITEGIAK